MTKHIIRIIVTLIILATIGYGAWVFFLKPNDNEYVYSEMLNVLETIQKNEVSEKLREVTDKNYMGAVSPSLNNEIATFESGSVIYNIREFMFGIKNQASYEKYYGVAQNGFTDYLSTSYIKYNDILNTTISYYAPYTQFANGVGKTEIEAYKNAQKAFYESQNELINKANVIISYQRNNAVLDSTKSIVLTDYYKQLLVLLTDYYYNYSNLIITTQNFVAEFATEGEFVYDLVPIHLNSSVYSIFKFTKIANFATVDFAGVSLTAGAIANNQYLAESAMYYANANKQTTDLNAIFDLVNSYNTLANKYSEILFGNNSVFNKTHAIKVDIVNGETSATAEIREEYIPLVQNVLIKLGFTAPVIEEPEDEEDTDEPGGNSGNTENPDDPNLPWQEI